MAGHQVTIGIQRPPAPAGQFLRALVARVAAASKAAALVPAGPPHHLAGPPAGAADDAQGGDGVGVAGVVGPVAALLDHDRGLGPGAVGARLRHPLGGGVDLLDVDAGDGGGLLRDGIVLGQQPLLPVLEPVGLEHAPCGAPLPRRVARALPEPGRAFPLGVHPFADPLPILPPVLDDHPGDGHQHRQVGARLDVDVQAALAFRVSDAGGAARQHEDRPLPVLDPGHDPVGEHDGLGLVRVGAADQQDFGVAPVLVGRPEVVEPRVAETRRGCDVGGRVVEREVRRAHVPQGVLGDGVGVLEIAVGEGLDGIGVGAVLRQHMVAHLGRDVEGEIPGHRHQHPEDSHQRRPETVAGRLVGVVDLLCEQAAADRGVAAVIDEVRVLVGDDDDMVRPALVHDDVVLVGDDPGAKGLHGEVRAEGVFGGARAAVLPAPHGPAIHLVAAGHHAVVARRGDDLRVRRRQRHALFGDVIRSRHGNCPHDWRLSNRPYIRPNMPTA